MAYKTKKMMRDNHKRVMIELKIEKLENKIKDLNKKLEKIGKRD